VSFTDQLDNTPFIPAAGKGDDLTDPVVSWLMEAVKESEAYMAAQPGWEDMPKAIAAIMSQDKDGDQGKSPLSKTRTNRIAKIAEDLAALMTDTKPFWDYSVSNRRFEQHAGIYGKLATFWYQRRNIDLRLADAVKYYVACGTGYLHIFWNNEIGDIDATAEDPRNVLPIRPTGNESLESCLGVVIKKKVPVNYIRDRYNVIVKSDSDGSAVTWLDKAKDVGASLIESPIHKFGKRQQTQGDLPRIPTVTLYTAYLKDSRTNDSAKAKEMGQWHTDASGARVPDNNWSYKVEKGEKLYPHRRMVVFCGGKKLYDGPSFYWHDRFPILKLTLNPFPWTWFGKAPIWDLLELQKSLNGLLRVVDDHAAQVAQPGAVMDKNNVSRSQFDSFDTRKPGYKILQNPMAGKGISIVNPPPLDNAIWTHINWIIEEMNELSGVKDLGRMMDLKQMPSNSTVESIINQMTPGLRMRSRILEAFTRELAMQVAYNFTEFYTITDRVVILGPGGITQDDFDFDPGSLIPDYVHDGDFKNGELTPDALMRGPLPKYNRTQEFLRRFIFKISPSSLLNGAQMERTMLYFQLTRAGYMDPITLMEQLNIPNIGVETLPDNVRTVLDRLQWCQSVGLTASVGPAGASAAGRKASGQEAPRIVTKES
jgi:hypothetical protein